MILPRRCRAKYSLNEMTESTLIVTEKNMTALRCGKEVLGHLLAADSSQSAANVSGRFVAGPDFERYRAKFETACVAAARVDASTDAEYYQAWYEWRSACGVIEQLQLTFGEHRALIESFGIDTNWNVELSFPIWWLVCRDEENMEDREIHDSQKPVNGAKEI